MDNSKNIQTAITIIDNVRKNRLYYLDLRGLMLTEIPVDISDLIYLLDVDLSYNCLSTIPAEVIRLENLRYLNVSNNDITYIDFDYDRHYVFRELDISDNLLYSIPESVSYINNDAAILYHGNPFLDRLPPEIEYQSFEHVSYYLELLSHQKEANGLYETKLIFVGSGEVGKTTIMKSLKDENYFVELGAEPTTHGIQIDTMTYDVYFPAKSPYYTSYKEIDNVYIWEEDIELSDNDDQDSFIPNLDQNNYIHISDTLEQIDEEDVASIMITNNLTDFFEYAVIKRPVKINLWDFGGQEIYYSTHQFFLTKRSIYVFVWEPRKDNNEEDFDYWLNTIKLLSSESPVIVVMNKSDIRYKNIDKLYYKDRFKNISSFLAVSCLTKAGIDELKMELKNCVVELSHIGDNIPISWSKIRDKITAVSSDFISYQSFVELCQSVKSKIDKKEIDLLSEYLHDIGEIIHFKDDSLLRNLVIINPQWATKAVYALIDTIPIQKNNGVFNIFELDNYWDHKLYPQERHIELLQLMEKFEICFKLVGGKDVYVIPELLKIEVPGVKIISEIEADETLKFQLNYNFMPHGIITRLICRLYNIIYQNNYWKNGVILQHELSKGLIICDRAAKTITISISGKQKGNLLAIIRNELKNIHESFNMREKEDYKEMIPCNCTICNASATPFYHNYDVLKNFIANDKLTKDCDFSTISVDIIKLISGYTLVKPTKKLIYEILSAASQLQGQHKVIVKDEDARNSFISARLSMNGIVAKDQSRWGASESGVGQGRLDIKIEDGYGNILSIFEGLNLSSLNLTKIESHIDKIRKQYDPNGLSEKYICIYYDGNNFESFANKYFSYLYDDNAFPKFDSAIDESQVMLQHTEIKVFKSSYYRTSRQVWLYHIIINMN